MSEKVIPIEKPVENWTKFPNCILDNIHEFTEMEFKVLAVMIRKNLGYSGNPNKEFSINYLCKKVKCSTKGQGADPKSVIKAIEGLIAKNSIRQIESGKRGVKRFEINWVAPTTGKIPVVDYWKNSSSTTGKIPVVTTGKIPVSKRKQEYKKTAKDSEISPPPAAAVSSENLAGQMNELISLIPVKVNEQRKQWIAAKIGKKNSDGSIIDHDYLSQKIQYANATCKDKRKYWSYLGQCIDYDWGNNFCPDELEPESKPESKPERKYNFQPGMILETPDFTAVLDEKGGWYQEEVKGKMMKFGLSFSDMEKLLDAGTAVLRQPESETETGEPDPVLVDAWEHLGESEKLEYINNARYSPMASYYPIETVAFNLFTHEVKS